MSAPKKQPDQMELDLIAEQELARLQRQYRIMEGDRNAYGDEGKGSLQKQRKVIKTLKKEQFNLMTDLQVAQSSTNKKKDKVISKQLHELLLEHETTSEEIHMEKTHLKELDYQISKLEKAVLDMKSTQATDVQFQARVAAGIKTVEALENRLEVATKKFCTILVENQKLREQIDHLLKERAHFNILWEKLISSLNQGKKFMLDLIEQATLAYDQREEWCSKLAALRSRGQIDLQMHTTEMRVLQRQLDHDSKLQEFLGVKGQRRCMIDLEAKEQRRREQQKENMAKQLAEYQEILNQITEFCEEEDIERLAAKYVKQEEENFALFKYVNELNQELEQLGDEMELLRRNIADQRELNDQRASQQIQTLKNLEEELAVTAKDMNTKDTELKKMETKLVNLMKGIQRLFNIMKCSNAPVLQLLGNNATINYYNVMLYLNLLEKRVTEVIINVYHKIKTIEKGKKGRQRQTGVIKEEKFKHRINPVEKIITSNPCPLCIEQAHVSDVIDTLQFIMKRDSIISLVKSTMKKPETIAVVHNVSACNLPKSRRIMQQRYQ